MSVYHTDGLWVLDGLTVRVRGRGVIASIPTPQNGGVLECVVNCRLIAAAPELLTALERLLINIDTSISSGAIVSSCHQARAAIAKATGEA